MTRRFRLARLERLRATRLAEIAGELAAARRAAREAQAHTEEVARQLRTCTPTANDLPAHVQSAGARRERLREQLADAGMRLERAQQDVALALGAWAGARAQLRAVQSLHERHRTSLAAHDARIEQQAVDELAIQAHYTRRRVSP